jgi:hypothetical protein
VSLVGTWLISAYLLLGTSENEDHENGFQQLMQIYPTPFKWRLELFGFSILNLVLCWGFEMVFIYDNQYGTYRLRSWITGEKFPNTHPELVV